MNAKFRDTVKRRAFARLTDTGLTDVSRGNIGRATKCVADAHDLPRDAPLDDAVTAVMQCYLADHWRGLAQEDVERHSHRPGFPTGRFDVCLTGRTVHHDLEANIFGVPVDAVPAVTVLWPIYCGILDSTFFQTFGRVVVEQSSSLSLGSDRVGLDYLSQLQALSGGVAGSFPADWFDPGSRHSIRDGLVDLTWRGDVYRALPALGIDEIAEEVATWTPEGGVGDPEMITVALEAGVSITLESRSSLDLTVSREDLASAAWHLFDLVEQLVEPPDQVDVSSRGGWVEFRTLSDVPAVEGEVLVTREGLVIE